MRRAPRVKPGQQITARLWNDLATAVDGGINAPKDIESAGALSSADSNAPADRTLKEQSRTTEEVRVTQQDNTDNFVDLERATFSTLTSSDGERWEIDWLD